MIHWITTPTGRRIGGPAAARLAARLTENPGGRWGKVFGLAYVYECDGIATLLWRDGLS